MSNQPISQPYFSKETVEQDLLNTLVLFDETTPWSLTDAIQNSEWEAHQDWDSFESVFDQGAQAFFSSLETYWQSQNEPSALLPELIKRLGVQIPQSILAEIAHKAQRSFSQSKAEVDAAILCVQDLLPQWSLDDLLVFNRPFSYAMRGQHIGVERILQTLESRNWEELSDFDQARACLAIAHYALDLINTAER